MVKFILFERIKNMLLTPFLGGWSIIFIYIAMLMLGIFNLVGSTAIFHISIIGSTAMCVFAIHTIMMCDNKKGGVMETPSAVEYIVAFLLFVVFVSVHLALVMMLGLSAPKRLVLETATNNQCYYSVVKRKLTDDEVEINAVFHYVAITKCTDDGKSYKQTLEEIIK